MSMRLPRVSTPWTARLITATLLLVSVGAMQRDFLLTGLQALTGDEYDGLIAIALIAHWHNVLTGTAPWHTVNWFYPFTGSLGYNDGYFLFGGMAAGFRMLGADPFLAVELTVMAFLAVGFVSAFSLARRLFDAPTVWAAIAATCATVSPGLLSAGIHIQLHAIGPALLWCVLLLAMVQAFLRGDRGRFLLWGCLAGLMGGALMLTAFYVFWIFGLLLLLSCLVFAAGMSVVERRLLFGVPRPWLLLAVPLVVLGLALLPALKLYLPLLDVTGTHAISDIRHFALGPLSLIDTGPHNLVWGWASGWLDTDAAAGSLRERYPARGMPPLTFLLVLAAVPLLWRGRADPRSRAAVAFVIAWLVLVVATVEFGRPPWLWRATFLHVPGAGTIRELTRVLVITAPLAAVLAIVPLMAMWRSRWRLATLPLLALLAVEQWAPVPDAGLRRAAELARISDLAERPVGCEAFVATVPRAGLARHRIDDLYSHNVDAMLLSSLSGVRTINGFSTFNPPGWDLASPNRADYPARVERYASSARVTVPLCGVDFAGLRWTGPGEPWVVQQRAAPRPDAAVGVLLPLAARPEHALWLGAGFHALEPWGVWSGQEATFVLPLPTGWTGDGEVALSVRRFAAQPGQPPAVFTLAGMPPIKLDFTDGGEQVVVMPFRAEALRDGVLAITIEDTRATSPAAVGAGQDRRVLGIGLSAIQFRN